MTTEPTGWHAQALEMRRTMSCRAIAQELGVSKSWIARVCKGVEPQINTRTAWYGEARAMRETMSVDAIADHFGKSRRQIIKICKGVKSTADTRGDWHAEAREMRKTMSFDAIAAHFGKSPTRVKEVCGDVKTSYKQDIAWTPEQVAKRIETRARNHAPKPVAKVEKIRVGRKPKPIPDWVPKARALRAQEMTYDAIAQACGTYKQSVIRYCKAVPVSPRVYVRTPEIVAKTEATRKANREQAIRDGLIVVKPKKARGRRYVPGQPIVSKLERRRRMIHALLKNAQQRNVPITLPKLRILEGMDT